ncbi:MAG: hypothetical protein BGN88_02570 [Clostridiales bacterium 43-6]|nr:MAG: hypothetical protein BGN88_02570 [Clostridiales bacterium 43-6]
MKKYAFFLCFIFLFASVLLPVKASAYTLPADIDIQSNAVMLASLDTGAVLFTKNADEKVYPASLTKIMTAVVALRKATNLDEVITVNKEDLDSLLGTDSSLGGLKADEQLPLRVLLNIMLVTSGGDAATVVANHFGGGDISVFVDMMNEQAKELKMTGTHFSNPVGLHDPLNYTTVSDMYKLTVFAITLPTFAEMCNQSSYTVPATNKNPQRKIATTNLMLNPSTTYYYRYINGVKTGYTTEAGRCLISTASKDGYNYICLAMGAPPKDAAGNVIHKEFSDTKSLYKWAFDTFEYKQVVNKNEPVAEVSVKLAWKTDHLSLFPDKDFSAIIPKSADDSTIIIEPILTKSTVDAPVKSGMVMGFAKIKYSGEEIGRVNIIATDDVNRNELLYYLQVAKNIVTSFWFIVGAIIFVLLLILLIIVNIVQNKYRKKMKRVRSRRRI